MPQRWFHSIVALKTAQSPWSISACIRLLVRSTVVTNNLYFLWLGMPGTDRQHSEPKEAPKAAQRRQELPLSKRLSYGVGGWAKALSARKSTRWRTETGRNASYISPCSPPLSGFELRPTRPKWVATRVWSGENPG